MAIRRCPYCKAIIDEAQKYCNNCGTQLLFPDDEPGEEPIKGEKITDEDFPGDESRRFSSEDLDEIKEDVDFDDEAGEEKEEIDLEKVIDGEVPLAENTGDDFGLIDLQEAETEAEDPEKKDERVSVEKPDDADEEPLPEIRHPDSSGPEEKEEVRPGRSLARRKKDGVFKPKPPEAGEAPPKLIPHRDGPGPSKMRSDQDTKFQIARLIADFERKRRDYTADLEPPKEPKKEEEQSEEPIGELPKTIEPEREAEAPESGPERSPESDFAKDDEFESGGNEAGTEEPASFEDRLSRLVGGFKSAVESGAESEEEQEGQTRHPEFMTGDLEEPPSAARPEEDLDASPRHPAFVTADFKSGEIEDKDGEPLPFSPAPEPPVSPSPPPEPVPVPPPGSSDERAALIARILKNRAERLGRKEETRVSKETSDALAALKTSSAAERAKEPEEPEETERPATSELEIRPAASIVETGEIRKPEEPGEPEDHQEPEEINLPAEVTGESREFLTDAWKAPSEDLPSVPTMGFPEELPKTSAPLSVEPAPEEALPPPVVSPSARLPEAVAPEPETPPPAPLTIEELDDIEEQPAPVAALAPVAAAAAAFTGTMEDEPSNPPVRAPVVRLGFFRRIRATIFDLLVVGAFWAAAALMTAHFLSMPLFELLKTSGFTMLLLYMILLVIYFFFFFLFLGETPGGRLVTPRD